MSRKELLERINSYFENQDIQDTEEVISAYKLLEILKEEFKDAREAINGEYYRDMINQNRNSKFFILLASLNGNDIHKENFLNYKCADIVARTNAKRSEALICFEDDKYLTLFRDFDSYNIYYNKDIDYRFINSNFDILNKYFNAIEEFTKKSNLYINEFKNIEGIGQTNYMVQSFSDGFLVLTLLYDNMAHVEIDISINPSENKNKDYEMTCHGRGSVANKVEKRKNELLKKVPININELNDIVRSIVTKHINKSKIKKLK